MDLSLDLLTRFDQTEVPWIEEFGPHGIQPRYS